MALYAMGDLHLCLGAPKPMDVFGGAWVGYMEKLKQGLSVITEKDTLVLMGDLSWALDLNSAVADFAWINEIPGRKIILKGNHDYWWSTQAKFTKFCLENGFSDLNLLNNNCFFYDDWAICGTRGWFFEEERSGDHDEKVFRRELIRLEASLKAAGDREKMVFLHYPPRYKGYTCREILDLLESYGVRQCFYGHLHGASHKLAMEGTWDGVEYRLLSADYLNFQPYIVKKCKVFSRKVWTRPYIFDRIYRLCIGIPENCGFQPGKWLFVSVKALESSEYTFVAFQGDPGTR